ncbi:hypothetical protein LOK49_LG11G01089 [Camellia lanceoleosa]|uniref:Uncharacterized protein n=1 Tax=Camellia lanceoleosa TaxID=1840588 RepID=A0ACC0G569_9ERIC|nr:hypothetical protein LOK49_LG11G01089 [Camellia lanceoleosa]
MVGPTAGPSPRQGVCTSHVKIIIRELMICTQLFLVLWSRPRPAQPLCSSCTMDIRRGMASNRLFTYRLGKGFGYLRNQNTKTPPLRKTWPLISLSLFASGFFLSLRIDGIHLRVHLVVYQTGSIAIGPLHSNIWVPPLLGLF